MQTDVVFSLISDPVATAVAVAGSRVARLSFVFKGLPDPESNMILAYAVTVEDKSNDKLNEIQDGGDERPQPKIQAEYIDIAAL